MLGQVKSRTLTSSAIARIHFLLLYVAALDIKGLEYLFRDGLGNGGLWVLFAPGILGLAGVLVAKRSEPSPSTWGWTIPEIGIAVFEILLGLLTWSHPCIFGSASASKERPRTPSWRGLRRWRSSPASRLWIEPSGSRTGLHFWSTT
jgi:hypothetical protein